MKRLSASARIMIATFIVLFLLTGCSTVSVQSHSYLGVPSSSPTDPPSIQILQSEPSRAHVRLGEISIEPSGNPPVAELENKLRVAAAKMGADAVFIVSDTTKVTGGRISGPRWAPEISPEYGRVIKAVAVKYTNK